MTKLSKPKQAPDELVGVLLKQIVGSIRGNCWDLTQIDPNESYHLFAERISWLATAAELIELIDAALPLTAKRIVVKMPPTMQTVTVLPLGSDFEEDEDGDDVTNPVLDDDGVEISIDEEPF